MKVSLKKYGLYLFRWQASTPILAVCVIWFATLGSLWSTVIANFIGGLLFFWIDRYIFTHTNWIQGELWEVQNNIFCANCGNSVDRGYRLVRTKNYNKTNVKVPEFRCHECSREKYNEDQTKFT